MPTMPHSAAGWRIEPPVSVPSAAAHRPAATAAALPPEEPPGTQARSHGLRVGWNAEFSLEEPIANSSMLSLPSSTAPVSSNRRDGVPSYGGTQPFRMRLPQVVSSPRV